MSKAIPLFLTAAVCALGARAEAAPKCSFHGHETVIMDNVYRPKSLAWGVPSALPPPHGPGGQNDPWSLVGYAATRVGWQYTFGDGEWTVGAAGDFDGDGDCDLAWTKSAEDASGNDVLHLTVTLTPNVADRHFIAPSGNAPTVVLPLTAELVGSGHFLDALGNPEPAGAGAGAVAKADLVVWYPASSQLGIWSEAQDLRGERFVPGPPLGSGARAVAVANLTSGAGDVMSEVVWRFGTATALSYWRFGLQAGVLARTGDVPLPQSPADANWWLRGSGDFNDDGFDDLIFQNLPNSERTVIWMLNGAGVRTGGGFTDPNQLTFSEGTPIEGQPRVIVAPR